MIGVVNTDSTELLLEVTGERSVRAVALQSGFDPSTLTRQVKSGIKAETVIDIARAYAHLEPVGALVKFGFLTHAEASEASGRVAIAAASDEQLAQEILNRVRGNTATNTITDPIRVDELDGNVSGGVDDLPHIGKVDLNELRQQGVALAADERDGIEEEQEQSQELP